MNEKFRLHAIGYSMGMKFVFMLSCPIFSSVACGLWVDEQLSTAPFAMFIFMAMGFIFAMYAVYTTAMRRHGVKQDKE